MPKLSDEAEEIYRMLISISNISPTQPPSTSASLAYYFGVDPDGSQYVYFLAAIQLRFERFKEMVSVSVPNERHRQKVVEAIERVRAFSTHRHWDAGWKDTKRSTLLQADLDLIEATGFGLKQIAPVIYIDADERQTYIDELRKNLNKADFSNDYLSDMMRMSLDTAIKMLDRFEIFGSSIIGEKLIESILMVKQIESSNPEKNQKRNISTLAVAISAILNLIVLADDVPTALNNHYTRLKAAFVPTESTAQRQLPPPQSYTAEQ